jgi:hypothetical protein
MEHLRDIHHVPEFDRLEIQHFFEVYKALEPGKMVRAEAWADRAAAEAEIEACRKREAESLAHDAGEAAELAGGHGLSSGGLGVTTPGRPVLSRFWAAVPWWGVSLRRRKAGGGGTQECPFGKNFLC